MNQVWVNVNTELPPDGWTGTIKVRFPSYVSEVVGVVFQKKNPVRLERRMILPTNMMGKQVNGSPLQAR
jgi:hypothetical protein